MKLQKNTILLVLIALGLGTYAIATERRAPEEANLPTEEETTPASAIFSIAEAELAALTIERGEETLRLVKAAPEVAAQSEAAPDTEPDTENDTEPAEKKADKPAWTMETPQEGPVAEAAIAFLVDLLLVEPETPPHSFEVESELLGEYGLAEPPLVLALELQDGSQRQLLLGNPSFAGQSLYARLGAETDSAAERVTVFLVNADLQFALERPVEEWLQATDTGAAEAKTEAGAEATTEAE